MTVIVALVAGLLIGAGVVVAVYQMRSREASAPHAPDGRLRARNREVVRVERVLHLLPTAVVLLDQSGNVRLANAAASAMGIVRHGRLDVPELQQLAREVRRRARANSIELDLDRGEFPRRRLVVGVRPEPLDGGDIALVVDDLTEAKRVEAVRRDFVANVGHEIKTPVGALTLLAEAALDARDDPGAVERFVSRIRHEASRLSRLVQELLDLSRIQGGEPLPDATDVLVDAVVEEAIDRVRPAADAKQIDIVRGGDIGLVVSGDEQQLVTALCNLLDNAVAYGPERTNVAVGVRARDQAVEVVVKDEGVGIAAADQARIFERFYRVDPARSRATGGTGLGLSIVKHIVNNHGGEVGVWSEPGAGSTFTIRLPAAAADSTAPVDREPELGREARST